VAGDPLKANPHDLAISPGGGSAWVTLDRTDDIAIVNLVRKRVRRYLSTGKSPHDLLFAPNGRRVWVTDWSGRVHVFSRKGRLLKSINRGVELHHLVCPRRPAGLGDRRRRRSGLLDICTKAQGRDREEHRRVSPPRCAHAE
jgi:DNA-binding beta-propeller fold protein YncE